MEGNIPALKKAGDTAYALGNFSKANDCYEVLYESGKFPELAPRIGLFYLVAKDRIEAAKYIHDLEISENVENAEAVLRFHLSAPNDSDRSYAFALLLSLPRKIVQDISPSILQTLERQAMKLTKYLPEFSEDTPITNIVTRLLVSFPPFRSLSMVFFHGIEQAAEYFQYLRGMFLFAQYHQESAETIFSIFCETIAPYHGPEKIQAYTQATTFEAKRALFHTFFVLEVEAFIRRFGYVSLDTSYTERQAFVEMLLTIAAILEDF